MIGNPKSVTSRLLRCVAELAWPEFVALAPRSASRLLKGMTPFNRLPLRNWASACDWLVLGNAGSAAAADPANAVLTSTEVPIMAAMRAHQDIMEGLQADMEQHGEKWSELSRLTTSGQVGPE
jgi:hypothetical protein